MTSWQAQRSNNLVTLRNAAVRLRSFGAVRVSARIGRAAAVLNLLVVIQRSKMLCQNRAGLSLGLR
jgi:hypothetical protein